MKNKYLGIICLLYACIIVYIKFTNILKNFLAPNMHKYILFAIIPLVICGIILLCSNSNHTKFKVSDLILLLPLILLIIAGNGRLTENIAKNRSSHTKKHVTFQKETINKEEYDLSNIDFDINDESFLGVVEYLGYSPKASKYQNKTIKMRGFVVKDDDALPKGYFYIGKYAITCCVADSAYLGLMVKYDKSKVKDSSWYEIEGVLQKGKDKAGNTTMYIEAINIRKIKSSSEEEYVYSCYSYGDGNCSELVKYDLEY